jgi:hypothetical protein
MVMSRQQIAAALFSIVVLSTALHMPQNQSSERGGHGHAGSSERNSWIKYLENRSDLCASILLVLALLIFLLAYVDYVHLSCIYKSLTCSSSLFFSTLTHCSVFFPQ